MQELLKSDKIPNSQEIEKTKAYAEVAELYEEKMKHYKIEPELIESTLKEFMMKRKIMEI